MKNYYKIPVRYEREGELKILKEKLEKIGISNPTYDEVTALLLEKNKRINFNENEIKDIIKRLRGVF